MKMEKLLKLLREIQLIIESESYGTIGSTPFSIYGNKVIYLIILTFGIYIF